MFLKVVITFLFIFEVHASILNRLTETVNNHSTIFDQFPEVMRKISSLENQASNLDSSLLVLEVDAMNLEEEVGELTNVSIAFTEKLNSFVSYETKSVRLEGMASYILEQLETAGGSLNDVGSLNSRTNALKDVVVRLREELLENLHERNNISQKFEAMKENCSVLEREIKAKVGNLGILEKKQIELQGKLDDFINTREAAANKSSVIVNCTSEQEQAKAKLQTFAGVSDAHDEISKKIDAVSPEIDKQSSTFNNKLEDLKNKFSIQQSRSKKEVQRIGSLVNTQEEAKSKLDELYASLKQVAKEQFEQEKMLKQLSEQLQMFMTSST
ncbi:hypothetical protein C0J52_18860 [Blattella germanica]|nr:hypothetical protein C0J52_18860 [Blattella germanica]